MENNEQDIQQSNETPIATPTEMADLSKNIQGYLRSPLTAIHALGNIARPASVYALLEMLDDEGVEIRLALVAALARLAAAFSDEVAQALFTYMFDDEEDVAVRAAAAQAIGQLSNRKQAIKWLIEALNDPEWQVREQAAKALGHLGEHVPIEALEAHIDDASPAVCQAVIEALNRISEETLAAQQKESEAEPENHIVDIHESKSPLENKEIGEAQKDEAIPHFTHGNVEFDGLEPGYFARNSFVPVIVQALDNQWATLALSRAMFKGKITYQQAKTYLEGLVRTEYIRALINGQQVIINRAFLYNNPIISRDYTHASTSRTAFKTLLSEGTIVPFLLYEHSPDQQAAFDADMQAFAQWQHICEEVTMKCVRFSWDQEAHQRYLERFTGRFHTFTQSYQGKDIQQLALDLNLGKSEEALLRSRLAQLHKFSTNHYDEQVEKQEKVVHVTRNILYKNFVTQGASPAERLYDPNMPLAGEIKQLLDLAYNGYLADALNGYLLTPIDSPTRLILQDWQTLIMDRTVITGGTLIKILRSNAFAQLQQGLYLKSMGLLTLQDVINIRQTEPWDNYIKSLQRLLKEPVLFADLAPDVYLNYVELAKVMTVLIAQRDKQQSGLLTAPWEPSVRLLTTIGGASLSTIWNKDGAFHDEKGEETLAHTTFGNGDAPLTMRLIIGDSSSSSSLKQARLFSSIELIKGKMPDAINEWKKMMKQLGKTSKFEEYSLDRVKEVAVPMLNEPER